MPKSVKQFFRSKLPIPVKPALLGMTVTLLALPLGGCGNGAFFGADGPSTGRVLKAAQAPTRQAVIVDVSEEVSRRLLSAEHNPSFTDALGEGQPFGTTIGPGDILQVTIYEAPPATLFGAGPIDAGSLTAGSAQRATTLPDLQVSNAGTINVPFAGEVSATGRSPDQLAHAITSRLVGKAHQPQVLVNIGRNAAATVTVVGEVTASTRMPLTPKGERLLDALAAGGGTRQPVDKITLQVTRGARTAHMPLDTVIQDPQQNVYLRPGDVVTALYQSYSFTALGGVGKPEEIKFETKGISLAQALGRIEGIRDDRANPRGVFIFRLEDPQALDPSIVQSSPATPDGKIPVIYRVNMRNPATFFAAQHFPMRDRDVLYVTNAPAADLQKFVSVIGAVVYPIITAKASGF